MTSWKVGDRIDVQGWYTDIARWTQCTVVQVLCPSHSPSELAVYALADDHNYPQNRTHPDFDGLYTFAWWAVNPQVSTRPACVSRPTTEFGDDT